MKEEKRDHIHGKHKGEEPRRRKCSRSEHIREGKQRKEKPSQECNETKKCRKHYEEDQDLKNTKTISVEKIIREKKTQEDEDRKEEEIIKEAN